MEQEMEQENKPKGKYKRKKKNIILKKYKIRNKERLVGIDNLKKNKKDYKFNNNTDKIDNIKRSKNITVKYKLNKITTNEVQQKIFEACIRTNKIVIQTYQFLKLWILDKYHNNDKSIPKITEDTIKMAFNTLTFSSSKQGQKKPAGDNLILLNEFNTFYEDHYKNLLETDKIDKIHLTQILISMAIDMFTNIENNIKLHFFKYVKRFVNSSFKIINNDILEETEHGQKIKVRKELNKDLYEIKNDLINNTLLSNEKYHTWIHTHRNNIFPTDFIQSYEFDIDLNPQKYLKSMIYMCLEIEKIGTASYQFFPLRTDITPKYIPIDTTSLIDIFINEGKTEMFKNVNINKISLWTKYFNLNNKIFYQSNYTFDYKIYTDGYSVSIQMINRHEIENEQNKKSNKLKKRNENTENMKDLTDEEKKEYKEKLKTETENKEIDYKLKVIKKKDKQKKEFK